MACSKYASALAASGAGQFSAISPGNAIDIGFEPLRRRYRFANAAPSVIELRGCSIRQLIATGAPCPKAVEKSVLPVDANCSSGALIHGSVILVS
jgi:hypothetical protein